MRRIAAGRGKLGSGDCKPPHFVSVYKQVLFEEKQMPTDAVRKYCAISVVDTLDTCFSGKDSPKKTRDTV